MATKKRRRRERAPRDVYQEITDKILSALETGTVPWRRPWRDFGMQRNLSSGRPYRGINQLLTQLTQQVRGYGSPFWLTYRGAERAGGQVRRGERGTLVVLWKRLLIEEEESEEKKRVWWVRPYTVFNLDQVDGVEPPAIEDERLDFEPIERCEQLLGRMPNPPRLIHAPGGAFYLPARDTITLPPRESFYDAEGYYATHFHETVHSTGHPSRLDRPLAVRSSEESLLPRGADRRARRRDALRARRHRSAAPRAERGIHRQLARRASRRQAHGRLRLSARAARRRPHPRRAPGGSQKRQIRIRRSKRAVLRRFEARLIGRRV